MATMQLILPVVFLLSVQPSHGCPVPEDSTSYCNPWCMVPKLTVFSWFYSEPVIVIVSSDEEPGIMKETIESEFEPISPEFDNSECAMPFSWDLKGCDEMEDEGYFHLWKYEESRDTEEDCVESDPSTSESCENWK